VLPCGLTRQYSLCGDPDDLSNYRIAVLRQDDGHGGSTELHQIATPGANLSIRGPRNHFPLVEADHYLFLAGSVSSGHRAAHALAYVVHGISLPN
jgi:ferredoxin-NADP reductase